MSHPAGCEKCRKVRVFDGMQGREAMQTRGIHLRLRRRGQISVPGQACRHWPAVEQTILVEPTTSIFFKDECRWFT